jgi:GNAT superfamily N-acetyltransferase
LITYRLAEKPDLASAHRMLAELALGDGGVSIQGSPEILATLAFQPQAWLRIMMAFDGAKPVGVATFTPEYSSYRGAVGALVGDLYVAPETRGLGAGRGLILAVGKSAKDWGAAYISLMVHRANADGQGFYARQGFTLREDSDYLILEGAALDALYL